jgi:enoyl-CoA hydratase
MSGNALKLTADGGVVRAMLNRPERGNALDEYIVEALISALEDACKTQARVFVLDGAGRHFCTGFDLPEQGADDAHLLHRLVRIETMLQLVYRAPFLTVSIARGRTFGAGADLFAACDRRITLPDARFAFPGAGFGILLGTRRLCERVGADAARQLVRTGRTIDADEALRINLANLSSAPDDADAVIDAETQIAIDVPTLRGLNQVTSLADDDKALADLVRSASRPGLAARLAAYREKVKASK